MTNKDAKNLLLKLLNADHEDEVVSILKKMNLWDDRSLWRLYGDKEGNFAFGIKEYIDIPGMKYDMDIGIIGLEVSVTLKRPGFRIKRRTIKKKKIPSRHKITKDEAISFVKEKFGVKFAEEEGEEE